MLIVTITYVHPPPRTISCRSLDGDTAVGAHLALETRTLARSELGHAAIDMMHQSLGLVTFMRESYISVVRVIHVVVDGIDA